jgi:hypothetical protein
MWNVKNLALSYVPTAEGSLIKPSGWFLFFIYFSLMLIRYNIQLTVIPPPTAIIQKVFFYFIAVYFFFNFFQIKFYFHPAFNMPSLQVYKTSNILM